MKKILIMGLPGSGKTTLANAIMSIVDNIVYWNADEVRKSINKHLSFSLEDRITQAKTMKWLSDKIIESGNICIVDFICPTEQTRKVFDYTSAYVIWVDRITKGRFDDTNKLFEKPEYFDVHVTDDGRSADKWADDIVMLYKKSR